MPGDTAQVDLVRAVHDAQLAGHRVAWLAIRRHHGLDGAARVYREVLTDASPPATAHVVEMALSRPG